MVLEISQNGVLIVDLATFLMYAGSIEFGAYGRSHVAEQLIDLAPELYIGCNGVENGFARSRKLSYC